MFRYHLMSEVWLFGVFTTVDMNIIVPRDVTPSSLEDSYQRCGVPHSLELETILKNETESPFEMLITIIIQHITSKNKFFSIFCQRLITLYTEKPRRFVGSLFNFNIQYYIIQYSISRFISLKTVSDDNSAP